MPNTPRTVEFFVSPDGNDQWTGRRPEPSGRNGPFASLQRARRAVRDLKRKGAPARPVCVTIRGGQYRLDRTLTFGPEDGGTPAAPVVYRAYRDEQPVFSGGARIRPEAETTVRGRRAWVARIPPGWDFRQLFVNGRRCPRTRLPENGYFKIARVPGLTARTFSHEPMDRCIVRRRDWAGWAERENLADAQVVLFHYWIDERFGIRAYDPKSGDLAFDRHSAMRLSLDSHSLSGAPYYVENLFEGLRREGQWHLDRTSRQLTYLPRADEDMATAEMIAPRHFELLRIAGTPRRKVAHLHFRGLTLAHAEWTLPAEQSGFGQSAAAAEAAVRIAHATCGSFSDGAIEHLGCHALELKDGCRDFEIRRNQMRDLGGGGIVVREGNERVIIADNEIAHGGRVFHRGVGVLVMNAGGNRVEHNHIHDFFYSGISCGWKWGYQPSAALGNVIEYNHIHDIGQGVLTDMGGIYTLGVSIGSRIRYNRIHDVDARSYGGWGIYLDEGTTGMLVEQNLVYRTRHAGFHQHYGRENEVRNNIFAFGRENQVERGRVEPHLSFRFLRNIVLFDSGKLFHGNFVQVPPCTDAERKTLFRPGGIRKLRAGDKDIRASKVVFDENLYFCRTRNRLDFDGMPLDEWRRMGHDGRSLQTDPGFADPDHGDFTLPPDSPARGIGFEPFDLSTAGIRPRAQALQTDALHGILPGI